jgi:flagellar hook-basal body complex protein FliE
MNALSAIRQYITPTINAADIRPADMAPAGKISSADLQGLEELTSTTSAAQKVGGDNNFSNLLGRMVEEVSARKTAADNSVAGLMSGQDVNLHQAMIATEEASLSFQLMVEVRNKLLESYQELMRMQV